MKRHRCATANLKLAQWLQSLFGFFSALRTFSCFLSAKNHLLLLELFEILRDRVKYSKLVYFAAPQLRKRSVARMLHFSVVCDKQKHSTRWLAAPF